MANCSILRDRGLSMLGYNKTDLDDMTEGLSVVLGTIKDNPYVYNSVWKARDLLEGLWSEGYFD